MSKVGDWVIMVDVDRSVAEMEGGLTLSRDIRRACQLLEKLQKSKYCGEVRIINVKQAIFIHHLPRCPLLSLRRFRKCCSLSS